MVKILLIAGLLGGGCASLPPEGSPISEPELSAAFRSLHKNAQQCYQVHTRYMPKAISVKITFRVQRAGTVDSIKAQHVKGPSLVGLEGCLIAEVQKIQFRHVIRPQLESFVFEFNP